MEALVKLAGNRGRLSFEFVKAANEQHGGHVERHQMDSISY